jgi:hypothetical protein
LKMNTVFLLIESPGGRGCLLEQTRGVSKTLWVC